MKAISITAMIFAVAVAFAVGWLTGSHAGYTAGAESEHVLIDARATLPEPAPPVAIVEPIRSTQPASGTWRTIALPGVDGNAGHQPGSVPGSLNSGLSPVAVLLGWAKPAKAISRQSAILR